MSIIGEIMHLRYLLIVLVPASALLLACEPVAPSEEEQKSVALQGPLCEDDSEGQQRPSDWTVASHCSGVAPDYDGIFRDDTVHRFEITVSADNYQATMEDLGSLLSGGGPGGGDMTEEPMWVPVEVKFAGQSWTQVGMRYKGNSSLRSAWQMGVRKLSFRLSFDKYEDEYPELDDQRFFGFKKMTFSNGFKDSSLMRDKLAADIFRDGGVPAARGAFAQIYIDFGEGLTYYGLYTMIEDPSNKLIDTQFDDGGGNLYKPEGVGATWLSFDEASFEKKTNEEEADYSDVTAAMTALHSDNRTSAPDTWRQDLEQVFHVEAFLRCLAINQAMVNWDSYGFMSHNYYIYADPSDPVAPGRLYWFPWDLNESMLLSNHGPSANADSVLLDEIGQDWPLIRFLLDDPVYRAQYRSELEQALAGAFDQTVVRERMAAYHNLIAPYVVGPEATESGNYTFLRNSAEFDRALTELQTHVQQRHLAVTSALATNP